MAAPAPTAPPRQENGGLSPKTVAPVTVFPQTEAPTVASVFPAAGETIAPGALVLKIVFDQKMDPNGFDIEAATGGQAPSCLKTPRLLNDGKTFVLLCTTAPKSAYALAFNAAPKGGFANIAGNRAKPGALAFSTNDEDGPRDLAAAMKIAKLGPADTPIETDASPAMAAAP